MPVRIAFTACSKFNFDSEQDVWREIEEHKPQHLMLLGDQIYMDFQGDGGNAPDGFIGYELGEPAKPSVSIAEFEFQMRLRYQQQFSVPSFRALVHAIGQRNGSIGMTWDDHDFGFNNALGLAGGPSDNEFRDHLIPVAKKQVSRRLFEEFRWNVKQLQANSAAAYRSLPADEQPVDPFSGVQSAVSLPLVDIMLLDTRSFRQSPAREDHAGDSSILGDAQWQWLRKEVLDSEKKLVIIAAGSPLSSAGLVSDQSWKQAGTHKYKPYREYDQLLSLAGEIHSEEKHLLFIGGDRHTAAVVEDDPPLPEFVCAGAAAPKGLFMHSNGRHFCLVDVDDHGRASVHLFKKGKEDDSWSGPAMSPSKTTPTKAAASEVHAGQVQTSEAGLRFSDLFLITDRQLDDGKPTDKPGEDLHYFWFAGDQLQGKASRLKNWKALGAGEFWAAVRQSADRLHELNPDNANQICLFVPGNRESNDTAIEQYRALNDIAFNAQGPHGIGTCILFDWATQMGNFKFAEIYRENIRRATDAAKHLKEILQSARAACPANTRLSLVAHSLGNRVALQALAPLPADTVDRFYANAADLTRDAFDSVQGRAALQACQSVLVPYTNKDFMLSYAESAEPGPRLGRAGPNTPAPARVDAKDISNLVSNADPHGGLFWFPWPSGDSGPLQSAFCNALVQGEWN